MSIIGDNGTAANMLKLGSKRRRTKLELEALRAEAAEEDGAAELKKAIER